MDLGLDLSKLNTATKYPSIDTYHELGPRGILQETGNPFAFLGDEMVYVTEKINGSNARIVCVGDDWYIGSREELLTAKGDRVPNPVLGIVDALQHRVPKWDQNSAYAMVYYVEVYGRKDQPAWKNYGDGTTSGVRLFDVAFVPLAILNRSIEEIARWRDNDSRAYVSPDTLEELALQTMLPTVPALHTMPAQHLPITVAEMHAFMIQAAPWTKAMLQQLPVTSGAPEGLVLRTRDRRLIRKARFQSYERTRFQGYVDKKAEV